MMPCAKERKAAYNQQQQQQQQRTWHGARRQRCGELVDAAGSDAGRVDGVEQVGEVLRRQQWTANTYGKDSRGC